MELFIILIIMLAITTIGIYRQYKFNRKINNININIEKTEQEKEILPYQKKYLLTNNEYNFYKILKNKCDTYNYIICPKVRLEDFITINTKTNILKYRGYIRSRHIDFLICDNLLHIKFAIELDDNSHNTEKAKQVDELKDNIFKTINIPLYRVNYKKGTYEEQITEILKKNL